MPRNLFQDLTVSGRKRSAGRSLRALPVSLTIHALAIAAVGFLAARPAASELQEPPEAGVVIYRATSEPAKPAGPRSSDKRASTAPRHRNAGPPMPVPTAEPHGEPMPVDLGSEPPPTCLTNCGDGSGVAGPPDEADGPGGDGDGGGGGIGPYVVGGDVRPPIKIKDASPVYPELARRIRVQGEVVIECVIDEEGRVADARVVRGHALLDAAALAAVRQWAYTATQLNGRPISVLMRVTIRFTLAP